MNISKEELAVSIEEAREKLNKSIDSKETYEIIYQHSIELDHLIEQYIGAGF